MSVKKHIPNAITCCNLFSGCVACAMAFEGSFVWALTFIVLGAVFDFFDGLAARFLGVVSPMGLQMDSLADDVTFGFAPAAMVFTFMQQLAFPAVPVAFLFPYFAFFIAVFSAVRLAKFNIDKRQTTSFMGLPTPANALFWASLVAGAGDWILSLVYGWIFILALILLTSFLLVCDIPMFSLKFKRLEWRANKRRYIFLIVALPMLSLGLVSAVAIIAWYVILSVFLATKR